jgi:hypothetical protein
LAAPCTEPAPTLIRASPLADGSSYIEATIQIEIDGLAGSSIIRLTNPSLGSGELEGPTPLSLGTTNLTNPTSGSEELEGSAPLSSGTTNLTNSTPGSGELEGPTPLSSIPLTQQGPRQTNVSPVICTAEPWSNNTTNSTYNLTAVGGPHLSTMPTDLTGGGLVSRRKSPNVSTLLSVAFAQAVGLLF